MSLLRCSAPHPAPHRAGINRINTPSVRCESLFHYSYGHVAMLNLPQDHVVMEKVVLGITDNRSTIYAVIVGEHGGL